MRAPSSTRHALDKMALGMALAGSSRGTEGLLEGLRERGYRALSGDEWTPAVDSSAHRRRGCSGGGRRPRLLSPDVLPRGDDCCSHDQQACQCQQATRRPHGARGRGRRLAVARGRRVPEKGVETFKGRQRGRVMSTEGLKVRQTRSRLVLSGGRSTRPPTARVCMARRHCKVAHHAGYSTLCQC